jgi:hypothetical protein
MEELEGRGEVSDVRLRDSAEHKSNKQGEPEEAADRSLFLAGLLLLFAIAAVITIVVLIAAVTSHS